MTQEPQKETLPGNGRVKIQCYFPTLALSKSGSRSKFAISSQPVYKLPVVYKYVTGLILTQEGIFVKKIGAVVHYQEQRMLLQAQGNTARRKGREKVRKHLIFI